MASAKHVGDALVNRAALERSPAHYRSKCAAGAGQE